MNVSDVRTACRPVLNKSSLGSVGICGKKKRGEIIISRRIEKLGG